MKPRNTGYRAQRTPHNASTKLGLRLIGLILVIIGLIVLIAGNIQQSSKSMEDEGWFEESSAGMFKIFGGLVLIMVGGMLLYYSIIGRLASYFAEEVSPAIETATEAAGTGISRGINRGGGIKLDINTHSRSHGSSSGKEIIKIKCHKCGYLETEDADFCSKCGKRL